jgi:hypothetical protein
VSLVIATRREGGRMTSRLRRAALLGQPGSLAVVDEHV